MHGRGVLRTFVVGKGSVFSLEKKAPDVLVWNVDIWKGRTSWHCVRVSLIVYSVDREERTVNNGKTILQGPAAV